MYHIWIVLGAAAAVVAAGGPLVAVLLVSVASRREESAHSLGGEAPGAATEAARRLLGFRAERIGPPADWAASTSGWPGSGRRAAEATSNPSSITLVVDAQATGLAPSPAGRPELEVRFAHARRSMSDAGQFPAGRQSQSGSVRADQRQGAGV